MAAEAQFEESEVKGGGALTSDLMEREESASDDNKPSTTTERHISIQSSLEDLENLVDLDGSGRKPCPLCPEEKFKSCYSYKLRRHLQNLHWKVYIEFQGLRMCICHLPCRTLKPSPPEQSRLVAHYHCVVCSGTIARRTDMISHLKRHSNRGETRSSFSLDPDQDPDQGPAPSGQTLEIMKELGTNVQLLPNHSTPHKSDSYFNRKMKNNRQLVFCALAVLAEERRPLDCLDAFGATGIMGLQWAKHLLSSVRVTVTDISELCVSMIRENCELNQIRVSESGPESGSGSGSGSGPEGGFLTTVEVAKMDANVMMHLRAFDYIHLDPFGSAVNFLDSAFRNVRNMGVVSVTSTDTGSLYAKSPNVTLRHYGASVVRTEYYRELGARVVLDSVCRAAARCNKGIEVLLAVALEHFVLVVVRVLRGPSQADEAMKKLKRLLHCQWCEERVFLQDCLPCSCQSSLPGKTAVTLGPLWSGPLYNTGFLRQMLGAAVRHSMEEIQPLLKTLLCESECTTSKLQPGLSNQVECGVVIRTLQSQEETETETTGKRKSLEEGGNMVKKLKSETSLDHPPFYYSIHRHSIKGLNMPKLNRFLHFLTESGFRVSRTHFDPTGVRTNADLNQFTTVLRKYSSPTGTKPGLNQD